MNFKINKAILSLFVLAFAIVLMPHIDAKAATQEDYQIFSQVLNADYYAAMNPDVAAKADGSYIYYLEHYIKYGVYEGRNASGTFNATDYMIKNPDLAAVFGNNMPAYVVHYVLSGKAEGRDGTPSVGALATDMPQSYTLLGAYTTEYDPNAARGHNIEVAAEKVDGTVVAPGATFSASNSIGKRTSANGFVEAPVFINKQHATGIGGGVCQVSSTIYAAMKTAGIKATERHPHSLPVYYLPEGWDATISWGSLDLKFVNTYDSNIVVFVFADEGHLTAALYLQN